jgi:hypothetical protein
MIELPLTMILFRANWRPLTSLLKQRIHTKEIGASLTQNFYHKIKIGRFSSSQLNLIHLPPTSLPPPNPFAPSPVGAGGLGSVGAPCRSSSTGAGHPAYNSCHCHRLLRSPAPVWGHLLQRWWVPPPDPGINCQPPPPGRRHPCRLTSPRTTSARAA